MKTQDMSINSLIIHKDNPMHTVYIYTYIDIYDKGISLKHKRSFLQGPTLP